jgi:hypothetical protein
VRGYEGRDVGGHGGVGVGGGGGGGAVVAEVERVDWSLEGLG